MFRLDTQNKNLKNSMKFYYLWKLGIWNSTKRCVISKIHLCEQKSVSNSLMFFSYLCIFFPIPPNRSYVVVFSGKPFSQESQPSNNHLCHSPNPSTIISILSSMESKSPTKRVEPNHWQREKKITNKISFIIFLMSLNTITNKKSPWQSFL